MALDLIDPGGSVWRAPSLASADRERVNWGGFPAFARLALPHVPLMRDPSWDWHHEEMCVHAQALFEGRLSTLVENVPPASTKSGINSVLFPAWCWTRDPAFQIMSASFDPTLSRKHAGWTLDIMKSRWFCERWGDLLLTDTNKGEYFLRGGGYRFATSVKGKGTGRHCDLYTIDDPIKPAEVEELSGSKLSVALERASSWIGSSVVTRASTADQRILLVMQRLHELDPSGFLVDTLAPLGRFSQLVLPFEFDPENRCVTPFGGDRRTERGQLLMGRIAEAARRCAATKGGRLGATYQAQYQQNPAPAGGTIFDPATFLLFDAGQT